MKAQIFGIDLIFAVVLFLVILIIVNQNWNAAFLAIDDWEKQSDLQQASYSVSSALLSGPGVPIEWTAANVRLIGLASEPNVIDIGKWNEFHNMSLLRVKSLLGLEGYELYIKIAHSNGTELASYGQLGTPREAANVLGYTYFNNTSAIFSVIVWED